MSRLLTMALLASLALAARAADIDGNWRVTITTPNGTITGKASLRALKGDVVMGWVGPSENDPIPVDGTVKGDKVIIRTHPQSGRNAAFAQCDVTVDGDRMTGTIDTDKGKIEFARVAR
ncbi:MAG TPA: hypothetical protein VMJ34_23990 [Bryobacteraceae bacterium]|nr:hypothetical protein [Bryobacteraceae bacterium]